MGFMNWLMKGVGFENEEVYDDTIEKQKKHEQRVQEMNEKKRRKDELRAKRAQDKADRAAKKYSLRQEKDVPQRPQSTSTSYMENPSQYNTSRTYSSPVNNYGVSSNVGGYGTKNVEFMNPTRLEEVSIVANYLKEGESVVLNLVNMNPDDSQRFLDYTSGAIYALNGNIRHVENYIYLLTPEGFNIRSAEQKQNDNV